MSGRQPLWPSASVFARSRSIARTTSRGSGAPTPAAWLINRFSWRRAASAGGDEPRRERPEPGRDPVDDLAARDEPLDDVSGLLHPRPSRVVERGGRPAAGDRLDVGDVRSGPVRTIGSVRAGPLGSVTLGG